MALTKLTDIRKSLSVEVEDLKVNGITTFTGNVSIGGTLTYQDVTNVDSVGLITARSGIHVTSGLMGLGTNNPEEILHVKAASETVNSRDGVIFQSSSALAADTGLPLVFSSHIGNDPNYPVASIAGRKENASSGDGAGYLQLATGSSAGAISEKARITSDGKVGINETTPEEILDLGENNQQNLKLGQRGYLGQAYSTAATILGHSVKAKTTGTTASGMIVTETNSGGGAPSAIRLVSGTIEFHTAGSGTADADFSSERLRITSGGNVDINGNPPWTVTGGDYRNLSISGQVANSGGFIWLGNGAATTNADHDLGRINFLNGATITSQIAGSTQTSANDDGRITFSTKATGGSLTEKVRITSGGKVKMVSTTANQRGLSVVAPATQINFGATEDKGGFLLSTTDGQFGISGGGYWAGSNWVATATASTQIRHDGGTGPMKFCFDTGLTAGNNFTPTERLLITPSGNMKLSDPGITFSDSSPYFPVAWSGTDGYNTVFTIASTGYANLRFRGEQSTGTEFTMGVGGGVFYMAYDDIANSHRITVAANGVVSLNVNDTSDEKMKKNITSLADGAISRIKQLRPVNFDWKKDSDLNGQSGFIAQEIKTVIPDLVQGEEYVEGSIESVGYSVNTTGIVAHLTKAVQEAITKIETLETKVAALEGS